MFHFPQKAEKGFNVSWSDDEELEDAAETAKLVVDLSRRWAYEVEAYDKSVLYEYFDVFHIDTCDRCEQNRKIVEEKRKVLVELENEKKILVCTVSHLKGDVFILNSKIYNISYSLKKMNSKAY